MDDPLFVGVDWSSDGWVAVAFGSDGLDDAGVFDGVGDLWAHYEDRTERVCIDVPIGLVEEGDPLRECDRLAREVLGSRSASVFTPPVVQEAAEATAGHEVAVDDVVDAVALAYTARPGAGALRSLPPEPPTDATGLPMRMVYRSSEPLAD